MLFQKPIDGITLEDIQQLVSERQAEAKHVEYKRALYRLSGNTETAAKAKDRDGQIIELAKDVSSFANSNGGYIILGVEEANGVPTRVVGCDCADPDAAILQMQQLIYRYTSPSLSPHLRAVECGEGRYVFVIQIAESVIQPHRVTHGEHGHFYFRASNGAAAMNTDQLRQAFLLSESMADKIRSFHADTFERELPVPLPEKEPLLLLHLIPQEAFQNRFSFDVSQFDQRNPLPIIGTSQTFGCRPNLNGILCFNTARDASKVQKGFVQIYRNGSIECVSAYVRRKSQFAEEGNWEYNRYIESAIVVEVGRYLAFQKKVGVRCPIWCLMTFIRMKGLAVGPAIHDEKYFSSSNVRLPEVRFDSFEQSVVETLRPALTVLWNAAGLTTYDSFDQQGKWQQFSHW